jgi:hypothetical protein
MNGQSPLMERTGWLVQLPINRWLERTTPSARTKEASRNLIDRAATPPLPRRGMTCLKCSVVLENKSLELFV